MFYTIQTFLPKEIGIWQILGNVLRAAADVFRGISLIGGAFYILE